MAIRIYNNIFLNCFQGVDSATKETTSTGDEPDVPFDYYRNGSSDENISVW